MAATGYGQKITVHCAPGDPEMFTRDIAAARRSSAWDTAFVILTCYSASALP
ncbi:hypothetical protein OIE71_34600 [Streptomyces sp. NBC_01725]|uniref:hypothetical protein n=1 Tax=Streptomyces sp. NBC_01725 TaxID=2975923 RepID=UPI002E2C03E2|nr:hypothetical protein [Streptomyces sp. NBC_01725]